MSQCMTPGTIRFVTIVKKLVAYENTKQEVQIFKVKREA